MWTLSLPPTLPFAIVNPIGAGDAVASGMFHALTESLSSPLESSTLPLLPPDATNIAPTATLTATATATAIATATATATATAVPDTVTTDKKMLRACAWGVAVGAASCAQSLCSVFELESARRVYASMLIQSEQGI